MKLITTLLTTIAITLGAARAQTVTTDRTAVLAWDVNPFTDDIAQYKLFASKVPVDPATGTFLAPELAIDVKPGDDGKIPTTATVTGLLDGIHYFAVIAIDKAGLVSPYSNVVNLTVDNTPPTAPKGLKFTRPPVAKNIENRKATIVWQTERPAHGILIYGKSPELLDQMEKAKLDDRQAIQLQKLDRDTTYYFAAIATDPKGRSVRSDVDSFRTAAR